MADWLLELCGELRAVTEELGEDSVAVWETPAVARLLACAVALEELVALRDGSLLRNDAPRHEVRREMEAAWERARAALAQGEAL